jgi:hypothetical protein
MSAKKNVEVGSISQKGSDTSSRWWAFWVFAIPAYSYFFGYCSKKYYLEALGFDAADISAEPGAIYEFAFNSLLFSSGEALDTILPTFINQVTDLWYLVFGLPLVIGVISHFIVVHIQKNKDDESKKKQNDAKPGKEKNPKKVIWLLSFGAMGANLLFGPIIIFVMLAISLLFLPPAVIGIAMAKVEIADFGCDPKPNSKLLISRCTTLVLDNERIKIGNIYHKDSDFVYIFTDLGPESIPIDRIKSRYRERINL